MSAIERPLPPLNADERATLDGWLEFHRATLAMKCAGLDDAQAASVPPSLRTGHADLVRERVDGTTGV